MPIEMQGSSRRVFPYRADGVVNFRAEALTLAAPVAMHAGVERPIARFFYRSAGPDQPS